MKKRKQWYEKPGPHGNTKPLSKRWYAKGANFGFDGSQGRLTWDKGGNVALEEVPNQYEAKRDKPIVESNIRKAEKNLLDNAN